MENASILVVDDDHDIVNAIAMLLEKEGYHILRAYNGIEAIDTIISNDVQLIIIDVMMPKLDGLSAMMRIRDKKNIPIIVLSAKSEDSDKILGLSMGADDYITKPYNPAELVARVKASLAQISVTWLCRYDKKGRFHRDRRTASRQDRAPAPC